jgi:hypothetical protein
LQGGGGLYPQSPSPATNLAVARFLRDRAGLPFEVVEAVKGKSVASAVLALTNLQGCQLWGHPSTIAGLNLTHEQLELVGRGTGGPAVDLDGVPLTLEQVTH